MAIVFKDLHKLVSHSQQENTCKGQLQYETYNLNSHCYELLTIPYGITSIQYPSNWTINETNIQPNITSGFDIVIFSAPPPKNYPSGQPPALVQVSLFFHDDPKVVNNLTNLAHAASSCYVWLFYAHPGVVAKVIPAFCRH